MSRGFDRQSSRPLGRGAARRPAIVGVEAYIGERFGVPRRARTTTTCSAVRQGRGVDEMSGIDDSERRRKQAAGSACAPMSDGGTFAARRRGSGASCERPVPRSRHHEGARYRRAAEPVRPHRRAHRGSEGPEAACRPGQASASTSASNGNGGQRRGQFGRPIAPSTIVIAMTSRSEARGAR